MVIIRVSKPKRHRKHERFAVMTDRYKAVLFDFDFTLGDSSSGIYQCVNYAFSELKYPVVEDDAIRKTVGYPLRHIFTTFTGSTDESHLEQFIRHFTSKADEVITDCTTIYSGVPELLASLKSSGSAVGIVSTKYRYRIEEILAKHQLKTYFDIIVGGEDVAHHKPHPEGLQLAVEQLGLHPSDAVYIGDATLDAEAAQAAGVAFAAVLTGTTSRETFIPFNPVGIYDNVSGLL